MRNRMLFITTGFFMCLFIHLPVLGGEIKFDRKTALEYTESHCSKETYNHEEYKCWNGTFPECVNYPGGRVDCATFVSQALIEGGLDFGRSYGAVTIGKGGGLGVRSQQSTRVGMR